MSFWDRIGAEKSDNTKSLLELEARTILENRNRSEQELETNAKPSIIEVDLTVESPSESPEVSVIKKEKTNHKSRKDNPRQGELSTENSLDNLTKLFDRSQLRQAVLKRIHRGHPGQEAMLDVSKYLWWPHMHKDIVNLAEECRSCTRYGKNAKYIISKNATKPLPLLRQPGQEVQLDYAGPLEDYKGKKTYLLVAVDRYSKFPSVKITKSTGEKCRRNFFAHTLISMVYRNQFQPINFPGLKAKLCKSIVLTITLNKNSIQLDTIADAV